MTAMGKSIRFFNYFIAALFFVVLSVHTTRAQETTFTPLLDTEAFNVELVYWLQVLDQADENRDNFENSPVFKNQTIRTIDFIRDKALSAVDHNNLILAETKANDSDVANQSPPRVLNDAESTLISYQITQATLVTERASLILEELGALVPDSKWQMLTERGPPPLAPSVIVAAIPEIIDLTATLLLAPSQWVDDGRLEALWRAVLTSFFIGLIASVSIAWMLRNWLLRRFGRDATNLQPSYSRRLVATLVEAIGRGLMPAIIIMVVMVTIDSLDVLSGLFRDMVTAAAINLVLFVAVEALSRAALAPNYSNWRMTPFDDESSRLLNRRITVLVGVFAILNALANMTVNIDVSQNLASFFSGASGIVFACFMLPLLQRKAWRWTTKNEDDDEKIVSSPSESPHDQSRDQPRDDETGELPLWMKVRFGLAIITILAALIGLFGYINLTRFILSNLLLTGILVGAVSLIRSLVQELIAMGLDRGFGPGHWFSTVTGLQTRNRDTVQNIGVNILDGFLLVLSVIAFLSIWGVPPERVSNWFSRAMDGISIGSYIFSLSDFLLAIVAFAVVLMITRAIQWLLDTRLLPKRLDIGIRQSIRLVAGYIGTILALMVAVSTLGIDLSSIALVAGALSVGIGFGLQAIVSNFISGLILLFERPIKPGDWIVVGSQEGFVTRINVRATELRTFNRASVIIPNSEILSTSVTNWNHKDSQGRVDIVVGIDYSADPEAAAEVLRKCGEAHPLVVKHPQPKVLFMNFGDNSQDLELRVVISEIEKQYEVASDLRFAIRKALDNAGVGIPFPQRVIHMAKDE